MIVPNDFPGHASRSFAPTTAVGIASNGLWSHVDTNSVPGVRLSAFPVATVGNNACARRRHYLAAEAAQTVEAERPAGRLQCVPPASAQHVGAVVGSPAGVAKFARSSKTPSF